MSPENMFVNTGCFSCVNVHRHVPSASYANERYYSDQFLSPLLILVPLSHTYRRLLDMPWLVKLASI